MRVTVCIVGFRNPFDVLRCLKALARTTYPHFEVIICENGGDAAVAGLRASVPAALVGGQPIRVVTAGGNVGYAGGVNACILATQESDAWWVLNPDTEPAGDALAQMVAHLRGHDYAAVGCTILSPEGRVESRGGRWRAPLARAVSIDNGHCGAVPKATIGEIDYLSGASVLVSRRFVETVGLMREDYFLYGEEVEWFLRGRKRKLRFGVAAEAQVVHHQGSTTGSVAKMASRSRTAVYLDERNKLLITHDLAPHLLPIVAPAALALLMLRFARRGAWKQTSYAIEGWIAGLAGRRGRPRWIPA